MSTARQSDYFLGQAIFLIVALVLGYLFLQKAAAWFFALDAWIKYGVGSLACASVALWQVARVRNDERPNFAFILPLPFAVSALATDYLATVAGRDAAWWLVTGASAPVAAAWWLVWATLMHRWGEGRTLGYVIDPLPQQTVKPPQHPYSGQTSGQTTAPPVPPVQSEPPLKALNQVRARFRYAHVLGYDDVKATLDKAYDSWRAGIASDNPDQQFNGILLYGPPGNGKTFIAEAFAGEKGLAFVPINVADVQSRWVNQSAEQLAGYFDEAVSLNRPVVLLFDEVDALLRSRSGEWVSNEDKKVVNAFLQRMTMIRGRQVLVMMATNFVDELDAAAVRPGRVDCRIHIGPPSKEAVAGIVAQGLAAASIQAETDTVDLVASRWTGLSMSRVRTAVRDTVQAAQAQRRRHVAFADFQQANRALGTAAQLPAGTPTLDDLALSTPVRETLTQLADPMRDIARFAKYGVTLPSGVLFTGPPGTGKTLAAKALAATAGWNFLATSGHDLLTDTRRIEKLLASASENRPCILFIDEADDIMQVRMGGQGGSATNKLLTQMDGSGGKTPDVMIVAATNHPEALDAAILRRLPFKAAFERPDQATRVQLVALFLKQRPALRFAISPAEVAALLDGLSHADATEVMREAANLRALENGRAQRHDAVTAFDLERARGRVMR